MNKVIIFFILMLPALTLRAMAQDQPKMTYFPASNIVLTYDPKTSTLHVAATHPSQNWEMDYVREMQVTLNGTIVADNTYQHQTGDGFADEAQFSAKPGDTIQVDLFCTGGMDNSQQLTLAASDSNATDSNVEDNGSQ